MDRRETSSFVSASKIPEWDKSRKDKKTTKKRQTKGFDETGTKRTRKLVELLFHPNKATLKVIKPAGKHLLSMGVPVSGGHEMHPEEAVFLVETSSAVIRNEHGREIGLPEAYCILAQNNVGRHTYEVYKHVKRTGLVVLRPREATLRYEQRANQVATVSNLTMNLSVCQPSEVAASSTVCDASDQKNMEEKIPHCPLPYPFNFPTLVNINGETRMHLKVLHIDENLVSFIPGGLATFPTTKALTNILKPTRNSKRNKPCRPPYWPHVLAGAKSAVNWSEYDALKRMALAKRPQSFRLYQNRKLSPSTSTVPVSSDVDFHVFSPAGFSHYLPAKPIFGLVCIAEKRVPMKTSRMSEWGNVVLAIQQGNKVNLINVSGQSIDLRGYIQASK